METKSSFLTELNSFYVKAGQLKAKIRSLMYRPLLYRPLDAGILYHSSNTLWIQGVSAKMPVQFSLQQNSC